jgi:Protein of unknown function (DUF1524)/Excalibur calcium-binding domain
VTAARPRLAVPLVLLATMVGCGGTTESAPDTTTVKAAAAPVPASRSHGVKTGVATTTPAPKAATGRQHEQPTAHAEQTGSAVAALAALPVKGRAPKTGYDREQFGDGWTSVDGCDTGDRTLNRDLTDKAYLDDCRVESGRLNDPYTAARITYQRGGASEVDIDHVVALLDAWQKGAQQWSSARRVRFANDPLNLLSVDASANRQKSAGDAATWLPSNKRFRCDYVARQVAVKSKYGAWVTQAEHDAIARVLAACPGEKLPKFGRVRVVPTHAEPAAEATATTKPNKTNAARGRAHYYENCDAARAAGAAPIRRGTRDYAANEHLDRDGDGVACE